MRIWLSAACIAATALLCAAFSAEPARLDYVLSPVMERGALRGLAFRLEFRGDADGDTGLLLPETTGAAGDVVANLSVSGAERREQSRKSASCGIGRTRASGWPTASSMIGRMDLRDCRTILTAR